VKHREYLGTFDNVSAAASQSSIVDIMSFALTPESMYFEWVNKLSDMYTFWRWRALKYKFKSKITPLMPASVPGSTTYASQQRATITAFCDYDARNFSKYTELSTFPSKNAMLDSAGGKCVEATRDFDYVIQCGGGIAGGALFSPVEGKKDTSTLSDREVNFGALAVRFDSNCPFSTADGVRTQMYDIWAEYEIEFVKPKSVELFNGISSTGGFAHYTLAVAGMNTDIAGSFATPNLCALGGLTSNFGISKFVYPASGNSALARCLTDTIGVSVLRNSYIHFIPKPRERYLIMVVQFSSGSSLVATSASMTLANAGSAWLSTVGGDDRLISTYRGVQTSGNSYLQASIVVEAGANTVPGGPVTSQSVHSDATVYGYPQGSDISSNHAFQLAWGTTPYTGATVLSEAHLYVVALGVGSN